MVSRPRQRRRPVSHSHSQVHFQGQFSVFNICATDSFYSATTTATDCLFQRVHTHISRDTAASTTTINPGSPTSTIPGVMSITAAKGLVRGTAHVAHVAVDDHMPGISQQVHLAIIPIKSFNHHLLPQPWEMTQYTISQACQAF